MMNSVCEERVFTELTCKRPRSAFSGVAWLFLIAILLAPIVAHGCHGDDVDHEPGVLPFPHHTHSRSTISSGDLPEKSSRASDYFLAGGGKSE